MDKRIFWTLGADSALEDLKEPLLMSDNVEMQIGNNPNDQFLDFSLNFGTVQSCPVCTDVSLEMITFAPCLHYFCAKCIESYLEYRITEGKVISVPCLQHGCKNEIPDDVIQLHISPSLAEKYSRFKRRALLERNQNLR